MEKTKRKLIVVGCSYSSYNWPTYSDFLACAYDEYYQLGNSGAGNRYIFNSLMHYISNRGINKEDTVIVQWSGCHRLDSFLRYDENNQNCFMTPGNLSFQDFYSDNYLKKYYNCRQTITEFISYITSVDIILKQIGCKYKMFSMYTYKDEGLGETIGQRDLCVSAKEWKIIKREKWLSRLNDKVNKYIHQPSMDEVKVKYDDVIGEPKWVKYGMDQEVNGPDDHPSPYSHYKFACEEVIPYLNLPPENINQIQNTDNEKLSKRWNTLVQNKTLVQKYPPINRDLSLRVFNQDSTKSYIPPYPYFLYNTKFEDFHLEWDY